MTDFLVNVECHETSKYEKLPSEKMEIDLVLYEAEDGRVFGDKEEALAYKAEIKPIENMIKKYGETVKRLHNTCNRRAFYDELDKYYAAVPQKYRDYYSKKSE